MKNAKPLRERVMRAWLNAECRLRSDRHDRGDVPGWVLITVMTAGIVVTLMAFAGPRLKDIAENALRQFE